MNSKLAALVGCLLGLSMTPLVQASTLRVATWNLGWHVSQAELPQWIAQCDKSFAKNSQTGVWEVVAPQTAGARVGWTIDESRPSLEGVDLTVMPPCGVYRSPSRAGIAVTPSAWAKRNEQIAKVLREGVKADVIAFQEVSGVAAVREALGTAAADYEICSFTGYKVQRLAFAWRKSLGTAIDPRLPAGKVDLVLCVDVYHEFSHPEPMLARIRESLTPDGRLVLAEFRGEDPAGPIKPLHKMTKAQARAELEPAGFALAREFDRLPWQHLLFFEVRPGAASPGQTPENP